MVLLILLGAGASVEADIPDAYEMTEKIAEKFRGKDQLKNNSDIISYVIGGLLFQKGVRGEDPFLGINVEELVSAVQLLAERNNSEAAPFVGSWHAMVERFDKAVPQQTDALYRLILDHISKGIFDTFPKSDSGRVSSSGDERLIEESLEKSIVHMLKHQGLGTPSNGIGYGLRKYLSNLMAKWSDNLQRSRTSDNEFDMKFTQELNELLQGSGEGQIFKRTADLMIRALTEIVWIRDVAKVKYLEPLLKLKGEHRKLVIASLNYDNGIELLSDSLGMDCTTGIDGWAQEGEFRFQNGICLLKLHGSINWAIQEDRALKLPQQTIRRLTDEEMDYKGSFSEFHFRYQPAVIFGQRNKLTAEGPFLDLLRAFKIELSRTNQLLVIGYSFRDIHVNEYISQWLNQSDENKIVIIDPNFDKQNNEYINILKKFKWNHPDRINVINEMAGIGIESYLASLEQNDIQQNN